MSTFNELNSVLFERAAETRKARAKKNPAFAWMTHSASVNTAVGRVTMTLQSKRGQFNRGHFSRLYKLDGKRIAAADLEMRINSQEQS